MTYRTLLLTPWYLPYRVVRWQDAITMLCLGRGELVIAYDAEVRSPSTAMPMPAVVRMKRSVLPKRRSLRFCRSNVFERDDYRCQYCGQRFAANRLSYDHVVPRAAGGRTEWSNIVSACQACNQRKGHLSCDDAGMWPLAEPIRPSWLPVRMLTVAVQQAPPEWDGFLPARR